MKKYELTTESINLYGRRLFRIRALIDFGDVKAGEVGGYIEREENLSHYDNAWVRDNAQVYGNAQVSGNAQVYGNAQVSGNAQVYGNALIESTNDYRVYGPCGSRNGFTTFYRLKDGGIGVTCGCFCGTLDEFREEVKKTHGNNGYAKEYLDIADQVEKYLGMEEE